MKVAYAACDARDTGTRFPDKLARLFLPSNGHLGRMVKRRRGRSEEFFLGSKRGTLEFTLLAEGLRKLGLLWLLIQNGTLTEGSILFWDEPETNLNPKLFGPVVEILLELQRQGVQIFVATHDYLILKQLDLQARKGDRVSYHALYRDDDSGDLVCNSTDSYFSIDPNAISEAFSDVYDQEIRRSIGGHP